MSTYDCFARIYLPLDENGKAKPGSFGNFDVQINSHGSTPLTFDSNTSVVDPVFAYGGINGVGYVKIFSEADTNSVYTDANLLCKYHFTASSDKVYSFVNNLKSMLTYVQAYGASSLYKVTSGSFQTYSVNRNNAYGATAIWCNSLGNSNLVSIYDSSAAQSDYMTYAAWTLFDQLYSHWQFHKLSR